MNDADRRPADDVWAPLRRTTQARIGLGRAGNALPSRRVLEFKAAHSAARDAVHVPLDADAFAEQVEAVGLGAPVLVSSRAGSRSEYLRRPDLGRTPADVSALPSTGADVGIVLADGLSPRALVARPARPAGARGAPGPSLSTFTVGAACAARVRAPGRLVGCKVRATTLIVRSSCRTVLHFSGRCTW